MIAKILSFFAGRDVTRKYSRTTKRRKRRAVLTAEEKKMQKDFVRPLDGGKIAKTWTAEEVKKVVKAAKAKVRK